jgi:uncharacterized protein
MPVIDVDSHVYEPLEVWDRVPAPYQSLARWAFYHELDPSGGRITIVNGAPAPSLNRSQLIRQAIWRPGMTVEQIGDLDPDVFIPLNRGAYDPLARLADMDEMGIDMAIVFSTLLNEYLPLVKNPDAARVLSAAYNDWVWDFCQAGGGRLHPVALLPLNSVLFAQRELDRVAAKGFRSVTIRPAFYEVERPLEHDPAAAHRESARRMLLAGASGASADQMDRVYVEDRPFRPLWAQMEELGVTVCVHPSLGITGPDTISSGAFADRVSQRLGARHTIAEPIAFMQDASLFMTAAFFHGLLEDHPKLRLAILHAGATWIPLALEKCETYLWLVPQFGQAGVCLEPEEVWDRHPILVGFDGWERPVARMPDRIGQKAAWGSRYPAHDTSTPAETRQMLQEHGIDASTIDRLLGGYAGELFGLRVPAPA